MSKNHVQPNYMTCRTTLDFSESRAQLIRVGGIDVGDGRRVQVVEIEYQARTMNELERETVNGLFDGFSPEIAEAGMIRMHEMLSTLSLMAIITQAQKK